MKRLLSLIVALCVLCGATALATELNAANPTGVTRLSVTVEEEYTLVIPAALPIAFGAQETGLALQVTQLRLAAGRVLSIACAGDGALTSAEGARLPYRLLYNGVHADNVAFTQAGEKTLTVVISQYDWKRAEAGVYTGYVTFTASIQNSAD